MKMTSRRPYLIKAIYDWIVDNELTPLIMVYAPVDGVRVPQEYVREDGQIVLNISPTAVYEFSMNLSAIGFHARFGGISREVFVPLNAVLAIYARENEKGMFFEGPEIEPEPTPPPSDPQKSKSPGLRLVK